MELEIVGPSAWERMRPLLSKAIERDSERDEARIFADLCVGGYYAFMVSGEINGAILAASNRPDFRICYVGGRIDPPKGENVARLMLAMEQAARDTGCTELTITGRLGWGRYLCPIGFVRTGENFRKVL